MHFVALDAANQLQLYTVFAQYVFVLLACYYML